MSSVLLTAEETEPPPLVVSRPPQAFPAAEPLVTAAGHVSAQAAPAQVSTQQAVLLAGASDRAAILTDGAFFSLMVGLGETYLPAFALALGASLMPKGLEITTGLLAAIPVFFGAILQLVTPYFVRRLASHRLWVVAAVGCQALSLMLVPFALLLNGWSLQILFAIVTVYWAAGLSSAPAWNTWMEDLIPASTRTHFFARRARICQFFTMAGFLTGGVLLELGRRGGWLMPAFVALFVIAALSRFVSTGLLASTGEPASSRLVTRGHIGLNEICRRAGGTNSMRMLWFLFAMQASVQISGPYFTPYMLGKLGLRYDQFMWLIVLGFLGKVVAASYWGKVAARTSPRTLLWIGAIAIVPVSGAWLALSWIERPMLYLSIVQFVGGIAWAAYELGFFLMFFEAVPRQERTSVLTIYNFGNSAALLVGAIFGALWLGWQGETHQAFLILFVMSSGCRLATLLLLKRVPERLARA